MEQAYRLHVLLDAPHRALLRWAREEAEASSDTEIVRCAVRGWPLLSYGAPENPIAAYIEKLSLTPDSQGKQSLYVSMPPGAHKILKDHKTKTGLGFNAQIETALVVFVECLLALRAAREHALLYGKIPIAGFIASLG